MNRKLMVAAVAAAFAAPAAFAQSSVTIGGTINILWDTAKASGATNSGTVGGVTTNSDLKSADRVRDGAGSNIRFSVVEDLGGGNRAFVQVESAVIVNSDQRSDALGQGGNIASGSGTAVWGNRNTGIGLQSKDMGKFLIGVWDVHYHETYNVDPGWIPGNSAQSILGLFNNFGASVGINGTASAVVGGSAAAAGTSAIGIGGRYSNVMRWESPTWSGFTAVLAYARPTDGAPPNRPGSLIDGKKNRVWNFAPRYENGGLTVVYSYNQDKDIANGGSVASAIGGANFWGGGAQCAPVVGSGIVAGVGGVNAAGVCNLGAAGGSTLWKITSNRLGARYKFANGFGIGVMWDQSKTSIGQEGAPVAGVFTQLNSSNIKRTAWALPATYDFGNHHLQATYVRANDWSGQINGVALGTINVLPSNLQATPTTINAAGNTGARMWSLGYQYNLSQRTNVSVSYASIRNDTLARYDFFANSSGLAAGGYGADPRTLGIGLRHTW